MDRTQMAALLKHMVTGLYDSPLVPPAEGGHLFHAICEQRRREDDLFWTERRVYDLARELGYWPWSVQQIEAALESSRVKAAPPVG